jgi:hypothetical protein
MAGRFEAGQFETCSNPLRTEQVVGSLRHEIEARIKKPRAYLLDATP